MRASLPRPKTSCRGIDAQACHRGLCGTNEGPVHAIADGRSRPQRYGVPLGGAAGPPSHEGVVIVGAGVDDFSGGTMRQVNVSAFIAKTKLQDGHAGDLQVERRASPRE